MLIGCALVVLIARAAPDAPATSDTAVTALYARLAAKGQLLVGAYSRFQWHHPGPLYFYALAPFYAAAGWTLAGLHAGAAVLGLACLLITYAVLMRRASVPLAICACGSLAVLAARAAEATVSPWNPHILVLPMVALIVAAADVVAGNPVLLPAVALLASLAGQAHIGVMPCAMALGATALCRACLGVVRRDAGWGTSLNVTLLALGLAWAFPLYEQAVGQPRGNVTELWQFFVVRPRTGQSLPVAISAVSDMFVGVLRPDFYVARGWPFTESPVAWAEWATLVLLATSILGVAVSVRRHRLFDASLGAILLLTSAVALWSATRIEERIFDHDVFWIAGPGALTVGVALAAISTVVRPGLAGPPGHRGTRFAMALLVTGAIAGVVTELRAVHRRSVDPPADARIARALAADLRGFIEREQINRPLVRIDQDAWGVVAGALLELHKQGIVAAVEEDWVVMFTPMFRPTGREDAFITVAAPAEHLRLADRGVPVVSAHDPIYAHVHDGRF
jgi:hypothetical protein